MPHAVRMPKPGQMTEECVLSLWLKDEGDAVARGDVLFEIETDKSTMEVESFHDGVVLRRLPPPGGGGPAGGEPAPGGADPGRAGPGLGWPPRHQPARQPAGRRGRPRPALGG